MARESRRRHRLTVEKPIGESRDGKGHVEILYGKAGTVLASIQQMRAAEFQAQPQVTAEAQIQIRCYRRQDLDPSVAWRLVADNGTIYNIEAIDDVDCQGREWVFFCSEDVSARGVTSGTA